MSTKFARIYQFSVLLSGADKRLLDKLCKQRKLKKTEVVRQLVREAARQLDAEEIQQAANG